MLRYDKPIRCECGKVIMMPVEWKRYKFVCPVCKKDNVNLVIG